MFRPRRKRLVATLRFIALMSPSTTKADVERHTRVFDEAVVALFE